MTDLGVRRSGLYGSVYLGWRRCVLALSYRHVLSYRHESSLVRFSLTPIAGVIFHFFWPVPARPIQTRPVISSPARRTRPDWTRSDPSKGDQTRTNHASPAQTSQGPGHPRPARASSSQASPSEARLASQPSLAKRPKNQPELPARDELPAVLQQ